MFNFIILFFIECFGVTLVNKILQVSSARFHNTSSAHCTVCSPLSVSLHPSPFTPPLPSSSPHNHHTVVCVPEFFFFLSQSLHPTPPVSQPLTSVSLLSMSLSLFCLLLHFVHYSPRVKSYRTCLPLTSLILYICICLLFFLPI